jgi:hypothetical protein
MNRRAKDGLNVLGGVDPKLLKVHVALLYREKKDPL